jgi:Cdc6-like AAA superfamily ATPase
MNPFIVDTILNANDICNLTSESEQLKSAIADKKKVVVYGPRNYGKTSLLQSVIIPWFRSKHKKSFVLQVDFMEARSLEAINQRICRAFEISFAESFPKRSLLESAKRLLLGFRPTVEFDHITGQPSLTLGFNTQTHSNDWQNVFKSIRDEIAKECPTLIVFDEFQDIHFTPEAEGLLRQSLQTFNQIPIIILGSKQHMLSELFAAPRAPFAQFGEDITFNPIPYEEYRAYINQRLASKAIVIPKAESQRLQDTLNRIPEATNIVCGEIFSLYSSCEITWEQIARALTSATDKRKSRYETLLSLLTDSEVKFLIALQKFNANSGPLQKPNGIAFLKLAGLSARTIRLNIKSLLDRGIIERINSGLRLNDPLLSLFIARYR